MAKKNAGNLKVTKMKPKTEEEKRALLEEDIKEYIDVETKAYDMGIEHLDKPAKFLETLTAARMFMGKDDVDYINAEEGLHAIEDAFADIKIALKEINVETIEQKQDPFAKLLKTIYAGNVNTGIRLKELEEIYCCYIYNMQVIQAGQNYQAHFFKITSDANN